MGICIIWGGIVGYMSAIKTKIASPESDIMIVTNWKIGNTAISWQRFMKRNAEYTTYISEQDELLQMKNIGNETAKMWKFWEILKGEIDFWLHGIHSDMEPLPFVDKQEWFGPRLGSIDDSSWMPWYAILQWLYQYSQKLNIHILIAEAIELISEKTKKIPYDQIISGIRVSSREYLNTYIIHADMYVLANGSSAGIMFHSTNIPILHSSHVLAYEQDCSLINGDLHLFHPFGRTSQSRVIQCGCYETDHLADAKIYLNGVLDTKTTELLHVHKAHYEFPAICKRFLDAWGRIRIKFPTGKEEFAQVSHHYSHLGIETIDGIKVLWYRNLWALWDSSSIGYWNGHRIRLPGTALSKCMVDAHLFTYESLRHNTHTKCIISEDWEISAWMNINKAILWNLKSINTSYLFQYYFHKDTFHLNTVKKWVEALLQLPQSPLRDLSIGITYALRMRILDKNTRFTSFKKTVVENFILEYKRGLF